MIFRSTRRPPALRLLAAAALAASLVRPLIMGAEDTPAPSRTVGDGVFSEAQVTRGRRDYNSLCARCHGETLGGGEDAPALVGEPFFKSWATKNLADYVEYTRIEMPSDGPGKVTRKQSTDITAFILSLNGYPVGPAELPPSVEALEKISIPLKK